MAGALFLRRVLDETVRLLLFQTGGKLISEMMAYCSRTVIVATLLGVAGLSAPGVAQSNGTENPAAPSSDQSPKISKNSGKPGPETKTHGLKVRQTHPAVTPSPFPLDVRTGRGDKLEFRSPETMTKADRTLAESAELEIERRAELQGFHLTDRDPREANWEYDQAVCPVFPDHLILEYSRNNGAGDVTLFSVVIPRGEGHVRVIPVRRRGYSLFTPSSANALTINDFNHMVKEGERGVDSDWLTLGLCYAALAGGHVHAQLKAEKLADEHYPLAPPPLLVVTRKGGATVRFADVTAGRKATQWNLDFAQNGRLLKVRHGAAQVLVERPQKEGAIDFGGAPGAGQGASDVSKPGS
jgi:hypothetical protein